MELTINDYLKDVTLASENTEMGKCIRECMDKGQTHQRAVEICWHKLNAKGEDDKSINLQEPVPVQPTGTSPAKPTPAKTKVDMIAEFKKLLQKNGMNIDDNTLLDLVNKIQVEGMTMKARFDLLELQYFEPIEDEQEILALPKGKHYVVTKGFTGWVDFNDKLFKSIIKNYENKELSEPYIDKEHDRRESYGDITGFRISKEGLYARVKLNKLGIELVKERAYKYISPTITNHIDTKGNKITDWLATISLVNSPALLGAMPALQDQLKLKLDEIQGKRRKYMDSLYLESNFRKLVDLSTKFGTPLMLQGEVDPEAIAKVFPDIVKMIEELSKKIQELTGAKAGAEKEAAVAKEAANAAGQQVAAMKQAQLKDECEKVITEAVQLGCYISNEKYVEFKKAEFVKNPDGIKEEIKLWKIANPNAKPQVQLTATSVDSLDLKVTDEQRQIAKDSGFDISTPEKILEFKKVIGG